MIGAKLFSEEAIAKLKQRSLLSGIKAHGSLKPVLAPMKLSTNILIQSFSQNRENLIKFTFGTGMTFETSSTITVFEETRNFSQKIQPKKIAEEKINESEEKEAIPIEEKEFELQNTDNSEENENILFNNTAKLYAFVVDENEKGRYSQRFTGTLHLNECSDFSRIVMRNTLGKVCLNCRLFKQMNPSLQGQNFVKILLQNSEGNYQVSLLQFKDSSLANSFLSSLQQLLSKL